MARNNLIVASVDAGIDLMTLNSEIPQTPIIEPNKDETRNWLQPFINNTMNMENVVNNHYGRKICILL